MKEGNPIDRENKLLDLVNYHAQRVIVSDLPVIVFQKGKPLTLGSMVKGERLENQDE